MNLVNCLTGYIVFLQHTVNCNCQLSEWLPVELGVPRGFILHWVHYNIVSILYDIRYVVKHSSIKIFADDISLYQLYVMMIVYS